MAKEIVAWCDRCLDRDPDSRMPATTTLPIAVGPVGTKPKTMDLCVQCHKEVLQPVLDAVEAWGVAPASNPVGKPPKGVARPAEGVGTAAPGSSSNSKHGNVTRGNRRHILGPFICKAEGCPATTKPSKNLDAFQQHLLIRHGMRLTTYREQYGQPGPGRPDIPEQADLLQGIYRCKEPGCTEAYEGAWASQALGRHMLTVHGVGAR